MNQKSIVVHFITSLDHGGAENQLLELLKVRNEKCEYVVVWLKGKGTLRPNFVELNIPVVKLSVLNRDVFKTFLQLLTLKKSKRRIILHSHLPRAELIGVLASKLLRMPLVVSKHNMERFWPHGKPVVSKWLAKATYKRSSRIICISQTVRKYLEQIGELPENSLKVQVVHYGISDQGVGTSIHVPEESKLFMRPLRIGSLSRLEKQKDIPTMIKAAKLLFDEGLDFTFEVFGDGSLKESLEEEIVEFNLEEVFVLGGKTLAPEKFLKSLDVFVLASHYEGFGLVILEAIRAGVPLVISTSDAAIEILGSQYPYFFEVGNFEELALNVRRAIDVRDRSMLYSQYNEVLMKFDIKKSWHNHDSVYSQI